MLSFLIPTQYRPLVAAAKEGRKDEVNEILETISHFDCYGFYAIYEAIKHEHFDIVEILIDFDQRQNGKYSSQLFNTICEFVNKHNLESLQKFFATQLHKKYAISARKIRVFNQAVISDCVDCFKLLMEHYPLYDRDVTKLMRLAAAVLSDNIFTFLFELKRGRYNTRLLIDSAAYRFINSYRKVRGFRKSIGYEYYSKKKQAEIIAQNKPKFETIFKTLVDSLGYMDSVSAQIFKSEVLKTTSIRVEAERSYSIAMCG